MKIHFLGTASANPTSDRDNVSLLIALDEEIILVDCSGSPTHKILKVGEDPSRLKTVIITHGHPDHLYGIPSLIHSQYGKKRDLKFITNPHSSEIIKSLINLFELDRPDKFPSVEIELIDENVNSIIYESKSLEIKSVPVIHFIPNFGLQMTFKSGEKSSKVLFSSDTGISEEMLLASKDADILIHDCNGPGKFKEAIGDGHTTAFELGQLAGKANVKKLIPIHFNLDLDYSMEDLVKDIKKNYDGEIMLPHDFMVLEVM